MHLIHAFERRSTISNSRSLPAQTVLPLKDRRPDVNDISGDLYHRSVPPNEAVHARAHRSNRLIREPGIPTLISTGSAGCPERLNLESHLSACEGHHAFATFAPDNPYLEIWNPYGPAWFCSLPYADSSIGPQHYQEATDFRLPNTCWPQSDRSISPIRRTDGLDLACFCRRRLRMRF